jgi:hypothetical protein
MIGWGLRSGLPNGLPQHGDRFNREPGMRWARSLARRMPEAPSLFALRGDMVVDLLGLPRGGSEGSGSGLTEGTGLVTKLPRTLRACLTIPRELEPAETLASRRS